MMMLDVDDDVSSDAILVILVSDLASLFPMAEKNIYYYFY